MAHTCKHQMHKCSKKKQFENYLIVALTEWYPKLEGEKQSFLWLSLHQQHSDTNQEFFVTRHLLTRVYVSKKALQEQLVFFHQNRHLLFFPWGKNYFVRTTCTINNHGLEKCT